MSEDTDIKRQRYEAWVGEWSAEMYRFACRLCGSRETADDLMQETFFHAWRSYHTLRDPGRARAWLYQILRHRYAHWVRTDKRRPRCVAPLDAAPPTPDDADAPLDRMVRSEMVQRALDELDERYRVPLLLVFMQGMTCQEAADQLKVPLGTVLSRIHRARKHLREKLGDEERVAASTEEDTSEPTGRTLRLGGGA